MLDGTTVEVATPQAPLAPQNEQQQQAVKPESTQPQQEAEPKLATTGNGKNFIVPQAAFKRAKEEAREKGRKEAIDSIVKELGLSSVDEFKGLIQGMKGNGKSKQQEKPIREEERQVKPPSPEKGSGSDKFYKEREKWQRTYETINQKLSREAQQRKQLEQALEAKDAEMALQAAAYSSGIRDDVAVEVAIRALTKHVENLNEHEQAKFDEKKFFEGLRETHPWLFNEVIRPATTGNGGSGPNPPKPGTVARTEAAATQKDARKMSPDEYRNYLHSRGLNLGM